MLAPFYLLALSFSTFLQVEETHIPGCICKVSGLEQAPWEPKEICRSYCPRQVNNELKRFGEQKRCREELKNLYLQYGFLDAEVACQFTADDRGQTELHITITEGPQYIVKTIDIRIQGGEFDLTALREALRIHPGDACDPRYVTISQLALNAVVARVLGDPEFAKNPSRLQGNKYVEAEILKEPEPGQVCLRYTVTIPPN